MVRKKLTLDDCKKVAEEHGGECLSTEYSNIRTNMKWKCKYGHIWEVSFRNILYRDTWCPHCANNNKYSLDYCKNIARERGGECLSTEYINSLTNMRWRCKEGHEWDVPLANIKNRKSWCPKCFINKIRKK